jgi:hypothetical protein
LYFSLLSLEIHGRYNFRNGLNFSPSLRVSLWIDSSTRASEDIHVLSNEQKILFFPLCDSNTRDYYLSVDLVDSASNIPIASGSKKFSFSKSSQEKKSILQSSNETKEISVPLLITDYFNKVKDMYPDMKNDLFATLSLSVSVISLFKKLSQHDLSTFSKNALNDELYNYRLVAPVCPLWKDIYRSFTTDGKNYRNAQKCYLSVDNLNLNKDILDLYSNRHILVRFTSKVSPSTQKKVQKSIFLGSIVDYEGNWLESCETEIDQNENYSIDIFVGSFNSSKHLSSSSEEKKRSEEKNSVFSSSSSLFDLHFICSGEINPSIVFSNHGEYTVDLYTQVTSSFTAVQSASSQRNSSKQSQVTKVKVGIISFTVKLEDGSPVFPENMSLTQLKTSKKHDDIQENNYKNVFEELDREISELFTEEKDAGKSHTPHSLSIHSSKEMQRKAIQLFGFLCLEISRLPYNPTNLSNALKYYLFQLEKILFYFISLSGYVSRLKKENSELPHEEEEETTPNGIPYEEIIWYFTVDNPNLVFPLIYSLNIYFQEWLASDIAQELLLLKQSSYKELLQTKIMKQYSSKTRMPPTGAADLQNFIQREIVDPFSNYSMINYLIILKKLILVFVILKELLTSPYVKQQMSLMTKLMSHRKQIEKIEIYQSDYLKEIAEDFLAIFIHYRSLLVNVFNSILTEKPEVEINDSSALEISDEQIKQQLYVVLDVNEGIFQLYDIIIAVTESNGDPFSPRPTSPQDNELMDYKSQPTIKYLNLQNIQKNDDFPEMVLEWLKILCAPGVRNDSSDSDQNIHSLYFSLLKQTLSEVFSLLYFMENNNTSENITSSSQSPLSPSSSALVQGMTLKIQNFISFLQNSFYFHLKESLAEEFQIYYLNELKTILHGIFVTIHYQIIEKKFYPITLKLSHALQRQFPEQQQKQKTNQMNNDKNYFQTLILNELSDIIRYYHDDEEERTSSAPAMGFHFFSQDQSTYQNLLAPRNIEKRHPHSSSHQYYSQERQPHQSGKKTTSTRRSIKGDSDEYRSGNEVEEERSHSLQFFQDFSGVFNILFQIYDFITHLELECRAIKNEKQHTESNLFSSFEILLLKLIFHFFWSEKLTNDINNSLDHYTFMKVQLQFIKGYSFLFSLLFFLFNRDYSTLI